jgi:heptosyltransferase I
MPMPLPLDKQPDSICILRLSAIGDITHVLPIVRTLQSVWPTTKITWIIGRAEAALVSDIEGIEFIVFDKKEGWRAYRDLRSSLSGRRFNVLLHMQVALRASIASLMIHADTKIGFDKARSRDFQHYFTNACISGDTRVHVIDTFFQFLQALGIKEKILSWDIPVSQDDAKFAQLALDGKPTLVINPCSSVRANNWRNWAIERYATVIDYAAVNYDLNIVLTGGSEKEERAFGEAIAESAHTTINNLIGKSSLKQLQAILAAARVVIAPDTGPVHMAAATGVPVIGLYASSNPLRTGPYSSLRWTVDKYPEALCKFNNQSIENAAWGKRVRAADVMDIIEVDDVTDMLDEIMRLTSYNNTQVISE